jgi:hypothetical protein
LPRIGSKKIDLLTASPNFDIYKNDTTRFIAHAGGMIDENTYTNSLEALDHNYDNGFRMFELDIIKTKDGQYVAAHDWNHWSDITGYKGELPATHSEFLKYQISGKFTPLDMKRINEWFEIHPDATLITDKVNEPRDFSQVFIDRRRLMMELFDLGAVEQGVQLKIKAMPSQNVIENMGGSKLKKLKELGINEVAISRTYIAANLDFLRELKENNIKAYAFHLNQQSGIDEAYVVKYEMDYIYGIYADKWDFSEE